MDRNFAVDWVLRNKGSITLYSIKYASYSPYEIDDFLSAAHEAALKALSKASDEVLFRKLFWRMFKEELRLMVPNPCSEKWSPSVPSDLCSFNVPEDILPHTPEKFHYATETIFSHVEKHLSKEDGRLLSLVLGLGSEGKLSFTEVGRRMGCTRQNVAKVFERCVRDIVQLIESGRVDRLVIFESIRQDYYFDTALEELLRLQEGSRVDGNAGAR